MSLVEVKKIVEQYVAKLRSAGFAFKEVYLFGSYAKGEQSANSDIDVAVVSPLFADVSKDNEFTLWRLRRGVDTRIEPHAFSVDDFANDTDPMVHEIKQTGMRIA